MDLNIFSPQLYQVIQKQSFNKAIKSSLWTCIDLVFVLFSLTFVHSWGKNFRPSTPLAKILPLLKTIPTGSRNFDNPHYCILLYTIVYYCILLYTIVYRFSPLWLLGSSTIQQICCSIRGLGLSWNHWFI